MASNAPVRPSAGRPVAQLVRGPYARVRERLEEELAGLVGVVRPALLAALRAEDTDPAGAGDRMVVEAELAAVEQRIAAVHDFLGAVHVPADDGIVHRNSLVTLDLGMGPQTFLIVDLAVEGEDVIVTDSPLGRAVLGAHAGTTVTLTTPAGPVAVAVLAVDSHQPSSAGPGSSAPPVQT